MTGSVTPEQQSFNQDMDFDRHHIWHPYSSVSEQHPVFYVESASGVNLHLKGGDTLIDGMASWWCAVHGYNHPTLNQAVMSQLNRMSHVMFGGLTHEPAITLARKLVDITPKPLQTVFFADSGSVSVEVAMKMAMQYWRAKGDNKRNKLLTIRNGYHGDTLGAMSVCDPVNGMHGLFKGLLMEHLFVDSPDCRYDDDWDERHLESFKKTLFSNKNNLVGVILEPIVQGAGGMRFYSPNYLKRVSELCKEVGILLIADEIATGFGRTGKLFACEHAGVSPDIMCVGKALTGGYMTLAATLCTQEISETISEKGVFMHGPTFMANPLACHVACASIDLLMENQWEQQVERIKLGLTKGLMPCSEMSHVKDVRVLGAIGVVELKSSIDMKRVQPMFVEEGVWVRPFGRLVYVMPPFVISNDELNFLCRSIYRVIGLIENMQ